ncbi:hypothetical protein FHG87_025121, partial [Trinorchestia longiramus]
DDKLAGTKIKMEDAQLSNGRDELAYQNRKMKHYRKQREHLKEGVNVAATMKQSTSFDEHIINKNTNLNNNIASMHPQS